MVDLAARLRARAAHEGLTVQDTLVPRLTTYLELLDRWNRKINLTSLSNPDERIDRLVLEPLAAAKYLPAGSKLADLGSGGGSPAIPLALALGASDLLMVESRSRKAAFLREAGREVRLNARVEAARFEDLSRRRAYAGQFDIVSVRAVRPDAAALAAAAALSRRGGVCALFVGRDVRHSPPDAERDLAWRETRPLLPSTGSQLMLLFHVEH